MNTQDLIESYVTDVARLLPRKQRNDVAFELRALLNEELQAKADAVERAIDTDMAMELLNRFGRPEEVAARYRPPGFAIIEPAASSTFVKTAVMGVAIQWALSLYHTFSRPGGFVGPAGSIADNLYRLGGWWISWGLGSLWWPGFLVACFGIGSWIRRRSLVASTSDWTPCSVDRDRINRPLWVLAQIFFICGATLFISLPWIVDRLTTNPSVHHGFAYDENFLQWRALWLLPLWVGHMILYWVLIFEGRWRKLTRRIDIAFSLTICGLLVWFIAAGPIFQAASTDGIAKVCIAFTILIVLIDVGVKLYREQARRIRPPEALTKPPPT